MFETTTQLSFLIRSPSVLSEGQKVQKFGSPFFNNFSIKLFFNVGNILQAGNPAY